jgi:hypothetical protein
VKYRWKGSAGGMQDLVNVISKHIGSRSKLQRVAIIAHADGHGMIGIAISRNYQGGSTRHRFLRRTQALMDDNGVLT